MKYENKSIINRNQYKQIKKFDRSQMESYLVSLYKEGFNDGRESVQGIDILKIKDIILQVKGIGEKRADEIVKSIEEAFNNA